jgi:5-methylthioadenosine/S-adenosylhomocysteine deaminase
LANTKLIQGGMIVTADNKNTIYPEGHILIEDNKILRIGKGESKDKADEVIDAHGCVIIPGLITAHTHLYGILLRGATLNIEPPTDFAQILQRVWWPLDEALTIEDAYASALSASADMVRNGSTFFVDTYSGPNSIEESLSSISRGTREIGIRGMLAFEMTERHDAEEAKRGLKEGIEFIESCKQGDGLVSGLMSLHASFTVSDELVSKTIEKVKELDVPLTIHTSEGLVDLYHNLERWGERTVERLFRLGALGPSTNLAHCVHVNDAEIKLIAKTGTSVSHNPMSNMLNAVGTSPVPDMLNYGITVGLGNDGWIYDPFENMRCALTVHRLARRDPSIMNPDQIFKMATLDGARCYGLEDKIGSIEIGKLADLVILDCKRIPTPLTSNSVVGHLINTFSGRDVKHVLVDGNLVVKNKLLTQIPDEKVSEISATAAEQLWLKL